MLEWGIVGTDSTQPRQEEILRRLGARVDADVLGKSVVHLDVEVAPSASTAAAVQFWEALDDRLTVLATDPEPSVIQDQAFDDRYDVLAASDVPSAVLAARLMRIDVGKELEPMSTVTIETGNGARIDARSWIVEIVDDGSPPGWDEPGRLAASPRDGKRPAGAATEDEVSTRAADSETPDRAPADVDERGLPGAGTLGTPSDERRRSEDAQGEATSVDRELDRLHAVLDEFEGGTSRPGGTPTTGDLEDGDSLRLRLRHLEAKLQSMESYAAVIEQFVDERGTPRRAFDSLESLQADLEDDLEGVRADLEALQATVADVEDRGEERINELECSVADLEGSTDELQGTVDQLQASVGDLASDLDARDRRMDQHERRIEEQDERIDHTEDRIATLEDTAGRLFALQRAQWNDLREHIETLEARERERIESLEQSVEQRDQTLRKTLAAWITDAELELFEMDDRVSTNESWRRSVTEATSSDPESE